MSKQRKKTKPTYQFIVDIDDETTRLLMALSVRWKRPVDWLIRNYLGGEVFNDAFRSDILDDDNHGMALQGRQKDSSVFRERR